MFLFLIVILFLVMVYGLIKRRVRLAKGNFVFDPIAKTGEVRGGTDQCQPKKINPFRGLPAGKVINGIPVGDFTKLSWWK